MGSIPSMKLTHGLLGEHALFYVLMERFEGLLDEAKDIGQLRGAADLLGAAVVSHAELEDQLLLSALEKTGQTAGPVTVMRSEHGEIEQLVRRIPAAGSLDAAREAGRALSAMLRDHFGKEEQVLFPMSEAALGEEKLEELGARWASSRNLV
jgi:hemerythrin-like domain-containing protein